MLKIRFSRVGKKGYPIYRIIVQEHTRPTTGANVSRIGTYNPHTKDVVLDKDAALTWLKRGAQPSNSVAKILKKEGLKHDSIVIKAYRAVSKKELEEKRVEAEKEREERAKELQAKLDEQKEVIAEQKAEAEAEKVEAEATPEEPAGDAQAPAEAQPAGETPAGEDAAK